MFNTEQYVISTRLFLQLLGFVYFFAFGAFLFQIRGLIGKNGILPIGRYLTLISNYYGKKGYYYVPTLFWINSSDSALMAVAGMGTFLSILLLFNISPWLIIPILFVLYLSIVSVGQDFLSFGWESFLLDITFNAIFLSWTTVPNPWIWVSLNLLLFRFHFQGGMVKLLSRDKNWWNLTGVAYHYQSQPIPNTIAWYFYKLPMGFHKLSTALMFVIELILPFGIFLDNSVIRLLVFFGFVGLQYFIWLTGNFSFLNHLTVVLSIILVNDSYLQPIFGTVTLPPAPSLTVEVTLTIIGAVLVTLQLMNLWNHFFSKNPIFTMFLSWIQPFHLINRYGIFAIMTTKRFEVVIEGSHDGVVWKEYLFKHKPSELNRRPRRISPYQPRIDWQAWFLPFDSYESEIWFQNFLYHLLKGTPQVVSLLRYTPFPNAPPRFIRVLLYDYEFTNRAEKAETGNWWKRRFVGQFSPILSLKG